VPVPALQRESPERTWHRDALTQASRARLFNGQLPDGRVRELSLLLFARAVAAEQPLPHPDLPASTLEAPGLDPFLTSLCEFDILVTAIAGVSVEATTERALLDVSYPNFAAADGRRANGVLPTLVFDPEARRALVLDADDEQLARVLGLADRVARREGQRFWGWEGYTDDRVRSFVGAQPSG